jgi:hypothetical protein
MKYGIILLLVVLDGFIIRHFFPNLRWGEIGKVFSNDVTGFNTVLAIFFLLLLLSPWGNNPWVLGCSIAAAIWLAVMLLAVNSW